MIGFSKPATVCADAPATSHTSGLLSGAIDSNVESMMNSMAAFLSWHGPKRKLLKIINEIIQIHRK